MNIIDVAKALQEGKKVTFPNWKFNIFLSEDGANIMDGMTGAAFCYFTPDLLLSEDWQVVEEADSDSQKAWEDFISEKGITFPTPEDEQNAHAFFVAGWESGESVEGEK